MTLEQLNLEDRGPNLGDWMYKIVRCHYEMTYFSLQYIINRAKYGEPILY